jgi:hypothetical protein
VMKKEIGKSIQLTREAITLQEYTDKVTTVTMAYRPCRLEYLFRGASFEQR